MSTSRNKGFSMATTKPTTNPIVVPTARSIDSVGSQISSSRTESSSLFADAASLPKTGTYSSPDNFAQHSQYLATKSLGSNALSNSVSDRQENPANSSQPINSFATALAAAKIVGVVSSATAATYAAFFSQFSSLNDFLIMAGVGATSSGIAFAVMTLATKYKI